MMTVNFPSYCTTALDSLLWADLEYTAWTKKTERIASAYIHLELQCHLIAMVRLK